MNELSSLISKAESNSVITLEKNKVYAIAPEDSFHKKGLFFSNTANFQENPEGERFCGIYLENKENITIDGNGSKIMIHGVMTPFIFKKCRNILFRNITIDHFRPTMSEMKIISSSPGKATVSVKEEFRYRIENNCLIWMGDDDYNGNPYWEIPYKGDSVLTEEYHPARRALDCFRCGKGDSGGGFPDITEIKEIKRGILEFTFRDCEKYIPVDTVSSTRCIKRFQTGGAIDECEDVTLEDFRIRSMNCFGLIAQNSKNLTYNRIDATPEEGRTIVSDADFFHFSGCMGDVRVINTVCCGAHDDIINIHGTHLKILKVCRDDNSVLLRYSHDQTWGFIPYYINDEIDFVSGNTLIPYHSTKVKSIEKLNPTDFRITVETLPETVPAGNDVIENVTRTASLTVDNCDFSRNPGRSILTTTRKPVVIRNTKFYDMGSVALLIADDANFWFESGKTEKIIFENNIISNMSVNEADKGCDIIRYEPVVIDKSSDKAVHGSIEIRNNTFNDCPGDGYTLNLRYVSEATVKDNKSDKPLKISKDDIVTIKQN